MLTLKINYKLILEIYIYIYFLTFTDFISCVCTVYFIYTPRDEHHSFLFLVHIFVLYFIGHTDATCTPRRPIRAIVS